MPIVMSFLFCPETDFVLLFNEDRKSLRQWFSKCGPWISHITRELVRNANSFASDTPGRLDSGNTQNASVGFSTTLDE